MDNQQNDKENQEFLQNQEDFQDEEPVSGKMRAYLYAVWMVGDIGGISLVCCSLWLFRGHIPDILCYILIGLGVFLERVGYDHKQWAFIAHKLEEFEYKTELLKQLPSTIVLTVFITAALIVMSKTIFNR